jgi:hypothetical protein
MEGPCADSEEKREPVKDIDTAVVDSLKVLDPNRPIREADIIESVLSRGRLDYSIDPGAPHTTRRFFHCLKLRGGSSSR